MEWLIIGIPQLIGDDFATFFILGLVFMGVGLARKDAWKKNYCKPTRAQRKATWVAIGAVALMLLSVLFGYFRV